VGIYNNSLKINLFIRTFMKQRILLTSLFGLLVFMIFSCQSESPVTPVNGIVQFSWTNKSENKGGRIAESSTAAAVIISLTDDQGNVVEDKMKLPLYAFGDSYISENLSLNSGNYKLTEFLVLNADDKVIYVAPLEGSAQAQYVSNPLPIRFTITENESTQIIPQVLAVTTKDNPEDFGYASFGFDVIDNDKLVNFELYTSQDFSDNTHDIIFRPFIKTSKYYIWDSTFVAMKIANIPNELNKISFSKEYSLDPNCDDCTYEAGFIYEIAGVGYSWYIVEINTEEAETKVEYDFK